MPDPHRSPQRSRPKLAGAPLATSRRISTRHAAELRFPQIEDIAERLHFSPDHGRIWLEDRRMVLLPTEAYCDLRAELIAIAGVENARGLITRMGYVSGSRDAELAKSTRGDASLFEAFSVGPQLHALKGMAEIELLEFHMDTAAGELYSEFLFKDSFEDERPSADSQLDSQSACWMLAGYASGYASAFMGKRILVREVECRAQGHAQCRAVAKPVEDWDDPETDLRYLQPLPSAPQVETAGRRGRPLRQARAAVASLPDPPRGSASDAPVGGSIAFSTILHQINRVAPTRAAVLLLGESGVGKSLFAREVHDRSRRSERPFIAVNCAAIPDTLIEAELFGVERGAYTGATGSRAGRFEMADGGTLFLDEIATLSLTAQGKLLRVLQSGEFERLGSTRTRKADVRVIAATNVNLDEALAQQSLRQDLYFRLNVFPITIPPLRERRDDLPLLIGHFLSRYSQMHERRLPGISPQALAALLAYRWPGNVRELENVIERGVILADEGRPLERAHLFATRQALPAGDLMQLDQGGALVPSSQRPEADVLDAFARRLVEDSTLTLHAAEDRAVLAAIGKARGNVTQAAALLGLTRAQLDYRLKKLRHKAPRLPAVAPTGRSAR